MYKVHDAFMLSVRMETVQSVKGCFVTSESLEVYFFQYIIRLEVKYALLAIVLDGRQHRDPRKGG